MVQISIKNQEDRFIVQIKDDGRGYEFNHIKPGNGIRNMQRRAKAIHADLTINSENGTMILLQRKAI